MHHAGMQLHLSTDFMTLEDLEFPVPVGTTILLYRLAQNPFYSQNSTTAHMDISFFRPDTPLLVQSKHTRKECRTQTSHMKSEGISFKE